MDIPYRQLEYQNSSSLKKRYFYKLLSNIFNSIVSILIQLIIPRALGPKNYGDFNFLTRFFLNFTDFFDMSTSTAFYTKLSQRPREAKLLSLYFYFIIICSSLVIGFVLLAHSMNIYTRLWPAEEILYIYLALFLVIIMWIAKIMNQITDAYGLTVPAEICNIFQRFIGLLIVLALFVFYKINLLTFFLYNYFVLSLLICLFTYIILKYHGHSIQKKWNLALTEVKKYIKEFYQYSHPLFIYSVIGMFTGIFDIWFLQVYGGSIQQGFFGLSSQIGIVCFLFTNALTPLLMREFSISFVNNDLPKMALLFRRYIPFFYSLTAYFSCFIALQAKKVIYIVGGAKYSDALPVIIIMAFATIFQTYGQLSGSVLLAANQTVLYRNIGIIFMLVGLPITYFLIAPIERYGMGMGATGLAIKTAVIYFAAINVQLYFNSRFLKLSFWKYVWHQVLSICYFLGLSFIARFLIDRIFGFNNMIINFIVAGIIYTLMAVGLSYTFPIILGLKRQDMQSITKTFRSIFVNIKL